MVSAFDVSKTLDNHDIQHGSIFWYADHHNIAFTDKANVFCKVARPHFNSKLLNKEIALAREYSETMLTPLSDTTLSVGDSMMSVWQWENFTSFLPEFVTPIQATQIAESLYDIHQLPLPSTQIGVMTNFDVFLFNIEKRIEYGIAHNASPQHIEILSKLLHDIVAKESLSESKHVLTHGDTHVGNAVQHKDSDKVSWIDFESAKIAPKELDIATLKINLKIVGGNHEAWDAVEKILYTDSVNDELIRQFTVVRMISMASYILLHPDEQDVFQRRVELLEPLLHGGALPSSFPGTSH